MKIEEHDMRVEADRGPALLERAQALRSLVGCVVSARAGFGGAALVLGGAGLGKTALLTRMAIVARGHGFEVLEARGSEFERRLPFGGARQLFALAVRRMEPAERRVVLAGAAAQARGVIGLTSETTAPVDPGGAADGLYWLTANLSDRVPLLLVIDDLHWIDSQTARWLSYLAARIRDLPVVVIAAARPREVGAAELSGLFEPQRTTTLTLEPLGVGAVFEMVQGQFGSSGAPGFVEACHHAAGGNPFYLRELLRAAAADGVLPTDEQAARVPYLGRREVSRSILVRVARLGAHAGRLSTAVAVLGTGAEVRHAAQLSRLTIDEALTAWDLLVKAEILREEQPLDFVHPIVRAAVHDEMSRGERSRAHREAAEMLALDAAPAQRVAAHAFACEPLGDQQVVKWLRQAAREAVISGAPDAAASYLERALGEPPDPAARVTVQFETGQALMGIDTNAAAAAFAAAAADPTGSCTLSAYRWRGYSLAYAGRMREAIESFDRAIELAGDDLELTLHLSGTRDFYASWWADDPDRESRRVRLQALAAKFDGATAGERRILAAAALTLTQTGRGPADLALANARKASSAGLTWLDPDDGSETSSGVGNTLTICDEPIAAALFTGWLEEVRSRGWTVNLGAGYFQRALIRFRRGELLEAEADARISWNLLRAAESSATVYWWSAAALLQILIARGELTEAEDLVAATGLGSEPLEAVIQPWPSVLRGELELAEDRLEEAIATLLKAGTWLEERGFENPAYIPWRAVVAPALAATGRRQEARDIIEPAVRRARAFGTPWALGMALRAAGVAAQGSAGVKLLHEAIAVLESSDCRAEYAHALLELGASLRRSNQRAQAREHLRMALDIAHRCGAVPLAVRAQRELRATGARPRRHALHGVDSLTASELRVAQMAATGLSNPEIAQQLFITRKTVETHLGRAYLKLDINSRDQLPQALR